MSKKPLFFSDGKPAKRYCSRCLCEEDEGIHECDCENCEVHQ